jgi:hypothetical protein
VSVVSHPVDPSHLFELTAPVAGSKRIAGKMYKDHEPNRAFSLA